MKGGSADSLTGEEQAVVAGNQAVANFVSSPQKQVVDTFKSSGELLTENAMVKGQIEPVEMGVKTYNALSYSAHLHKKGVHKLSGKFMLLAIHYAHQMRTGETQAGRYAIKIILTACLAPAMYVAGGGFYPAQKLGLKIFKKIFPYDFAKRHSQNYFSDLIKKRSELYDTLSANGARISKDESAKMNEQLAKESKMLGTGNIVRTKSGDV